MIKLYGYQAEALKAISKAFSINFRALVVMATGLGKTIVAGLWAKDEIENGKGLFLCHEIGILEQAKKKFAEIVGKSKKLKAIYGEERNQNVEDADMIFASFQSMVSRKESFDPYAFDFIIVDESHHGQAPMYREVIQYFKPRKLLGITATPDREDEKDIRELFGEEVVNIPLEEGIAKGWLTPVEYHVITDNLNCDILAQIQKEIFEEGKRVSMKQLNKELFIRARDKKISETIMEFAQGNKKVILFCENIKHVDHFVKFLPSAAVYHSGIDSDVNQKTLESFRNGKLQYILTVDKFNEGIDIPDAEVVAFLRVTNSRRVFLQQLGRGLRKLLGKEKVVVLDFVANCERLLLVREMIESIKKFVRTDEATESKDALHISGSAYDFIFTNEQLDIFEVINRINSTIYLTWQEASEATIAAGIKDSLEYKVRYKAADPRLPGSPYDMYADFPGWGVFLGTQRQRRTVMYATWQEASVAAIKLGIKTKEEYMVRYKEDPKLIANLARKYTGFPGYVTFFGKDFYPTWQEASKAAIALGFHSAPPYQKACRELDSKLPVHPRLVYEDFPGWGTFFETGRTKRARSEFYATWQETSAVVIKAGITSMSDYRAKYKKLDPKLPSNPNKAYEDFPGWGAFFGTGIEVRAREDFIQTWQEASEVCIKNGIKNILDYKERYKKISTRLPSNPNEFYLDFPSWKVYLGKKKVQ